MKILLLTQWFNPEPMFKGLAFAEGLAKGHDIEVLTGFPTIPAARSIAAIESSPGNLIT